LKIFIKPNKHYTMKIRNILAALTCILLVVYSESYAQLEVPRPSPAASVTQTVGFTEVSIEYSSPGVKGREIFGGLLPYGVTWRAGANAPTAITFSNSVTIGDQNLRAGTYNMFITPEEEGEWTVHFNGEGKSVFAYMSDGKIDEAALVADNAASIKVAPESTDGLVERLRFMISPTDNTKAHITMEWENVNLTFPVDVRTEAIMNQLQETLK
jgi:hypothetical protein